MDTQKNKLFENSYRIKMNKDWFIKREFPVLWQSQPTLGERARSLAKWYVLYKDLPWNTDLHEQLNQFDQKLQTLRYQRNETQLKEVQELQKTIKEEMKSNEEKIFRIIDLYSSPGEEKDRWELQRTSLESSFTEQLKSYQEYKEQRSVENSELDLGEALKTVQKNITACQEEFKVYRKTLDDYQQLQTLVGFVNYKDKEIGDSHFSSYQTRADKLTQQLQKVQDQITVMLSPETSADLAQLDEEVKLLQATYKDFLLRDEQFWELVPQLARSLGREILRKQRELFGNGETLEKQREIIENKRDEYENELANFPDFSHLELMFDKIDMIINKWLIPGGKGDNTLSDQPLGEGYETFSDCTKSLKEDIQLLNKHFQLLEDTLRTIKLQKEPWGVSEIGKQLQIAASMIAKPTVEKLEKLRLEHLKIDKLKAYPGEWDAKCDQDSYGVNPHSAWLGDGVGGSPDGGKASRIFCDFMTKQSRKISPDLPIEDIIFALHTLIENTSIKAFYQTYPEDEIPLDETSESIKGEKLSATTLAGIFVLPGNRAILLIAGDSIIYRYDRERQFLEHLTVAEDNWTLCCCGAEPDPSSGMLTAMKMKEYAETLKKQQEHNDQPILENEKRTRQSSLTSLKNPVWNRLGTLPGMDQFNKQLITTRLVEFKPGQRFILASDGGPDNINNKGMEKILNAHLNPEETAASLCQAAFDVSISGGHLDDITYVVGEFKGDSVQREQFLKKYTNNCYNKLSERIKEFKGLPLVIEKKDQITQEMPTLALLAKDNEKLADLAKNLQELPKAIHREINNLSYLVVAEYFEQKYSISKESELKNKTEKEAISDSNKYHPDKKLKTENESKYSRSRRDSDTDSVSSEDTQLNDGKSSFTKETTTSDDTKVFTLDKIISEGEKLKKYLRTAERRRQKLQDEIQSFNEIFFSKDTIGQKLIDQALADWRNGGDLNQTEVDGHKFTEMLQKISRLYHRAEALQEIFAKFLDGENKLEDYRFCIEVATLMNHKHKDDILASSAETWLERQFMEASKRTHTEANFSAPYEKIKLGIQEALRLVKVWDHYESLIERFNGLGETWDWDLRATTNAKKEIEDIRREVSKNTTLVQNPLPQLQIGVLSSSDKLTLEVKGSFHRNYSQAEIDIKRTNGYLQAIEHQLATQEEEKRRFEAMPQASRERLIEIKKRYEASFAESSKNLTEAQEEIHQYPTVRWRAYAYGLVVIFNNHADKLDVEKLKNALERVQNSLDQLFGCGPHAMDVDSNDASEDSQALGALRTYVKELQQWREDIKSEKSATNIDYLITFDDNLKKYEYKLNEVERVVNGVEEEDEEEDENSETVYFEVNMCKKISNLLTEYFTEIDIFELKTTRAQMALESAISRVKDANDHNRFEELFSEADWEEGGDNSTSVLSMTGGASRSTVDSLGYQSESSIFDSPAEVSRKSYSDLDGLTPELKSLDGLLKRLLPLLEQI